MSTEFRGGRGGRFGERDRYGDRFDERRYNRRDDAPRGYRDDRYGGRRDREGLLQSSQRRPICVA